MSKKFWQNLFWFVIFVRVILALTAPLVDDETYHWTWTKMLSLSYFDHPAMVAWLESISTTLFGHGKLGIRLPSFLCYLGVCLISWQLTRELFSEIAARVVVFLLLFTPLWGVGGYVASPEPSFLLIWCAVLWVFWQGVRPPESGKPAWSTKKTWLTLGVLMGLGLNAKFPIALIAPGMGLYLLTEKRLRQQLATPWPWLAILIATILTSPVFIWNFQHDWPGFKYQFHDRHVSEGGFDFIRWLQFFGYQILFMTPVVYLFLVLAWFKSLSLFNKASYRFVFCLSLPMLAIFYIQPFFAQFKPHWCGAAHLILAMAAGQLWAEGWAKLKIKPMSRKVVYGVLGFIIPLNLIAYVPIYTPIVPKIYRFFNPQSEWNPLWDFSNELHGWDEFGQWALSKKEEVSLTEGQEPILASYRYELVSRFWYHTQERAWALSRETSHFKVWQAGTEAEDLKGRTVLFMASDKYSDPPQDYIDFESCDEAEILRTYRGHHHSRTFYLWKCHGFKGIKP